jgi:hypothetical protein
MLGHRKENTRNIHNIAEATIIDDVAQTISNIYVALEECPKNHQSVVIEFEGRIAKKSLFILIDLGSSDSYVNYRFFETYPLKKCKHKKSWIV